MGSRKTSLGRKIIRVTPSERTRIIDGIAGSEAARAGHPSRGLLVLGDAGVACHEFGDVLGVSAEAPLPRIGITGQFFSHDGACGIASMLHYWGLDVVVSSPIGRGQNSAIKRRLLRKESLPHIPLCTGLGQSIRCTRRAFAGGHQLGHFESEELIPAASRKEVARARASFEHRLGKAGLFCILDQGAAGLSTEIISRLAAQAKRLKASVFYEPRSTHFVSNRAFDIIKVNQNQIRQWLGTNIDSDRKAVMALEEVFADSAHASVVCTRGDRGILVYDRSGPSPKVFLVTPRPKKIFDLIAAGDVVTASLAFCIAKGYTMLEAACFAATAAELSLDQRHDKHLNVQSVFNNRDP